jgi:hypothetical protein
MYVYIYMCVYICEPAHLVCKAASTLLVLMLQRLAVTCRCVQTTTLPTL